jgi:hypothetical protein
VELSGDLLRWAALLEKGKHLDLTGGEMRVWRCRRIVGAFLEQPEDADHPFTAHERHRADLHGHPRAGVETKTAGASVAEEVPSTLRENSSRARRLSSGATTGDRERRRQAARPPDWSTGRPLRVEDVARDADAAQSLLDVAADCQASGDHRSMASRTGLLACSLGRLDDRPRPRLKACDARNCVLSSVLPSLIFV